MQGHRFYRVFSWFTMMLLVFAATLSAQTSKGIIAGTITDDSGAAVSGATIDIVSLDNGEKRSATTGAAGNFRIEAITTGSYDVKVEKAGYAVLTINALKVSASVITPLDGVLKIGSQSTTVVVKAENNQVETESGSITGNVSTTEISSLPISDLNPVSLILTLPGVTSTGQNFANGGDYSVNGLRSRGNAFLIEGQDNNDNSIAGQSVMLFDPNLVQEVTFLTNAYSAEFGHGGSSVTNVVLKSGTNKYHGTLSEYYAGSGLQALDSYYKYFGWTSRDKSRWDEHTYGGTFGGPILKNKLFGFVGYTEDHVYGQGSTATVWAPDADAMAFLKSYGTTNATMLYKLYGNGSIVSTASKTYRAQTVNGTTLNFYPAVVPTVALDDYNKELNVKVDVIPTAKDTFTARATHITGIYAPYSVGLPGFETEWSGPSDSYAASWTRTFSPTIVNELRTSFGHFAYLFQPTSNTTSNPYLYYPTISITGITSYGLSATYPQGRKHNSYEAQDTMTIQKGRQTIKFGMQLNKLSIHDIAPFNSRGAIAVRSGGGYTALQNFLDDYTGAGTSLVSIIVGDNNLYPEVWQQSYFLQDTFKLTSTVTLDLGVRYEYQQNPENTLKYPAIDISKAPYDTISDVYKVKEDKNNFAPRIGLAYSPRSKNILLGDGKTAFRFGYGLFFDTFFTNILDNTATAAPNANSSISGTWTGRGYSGMLAAVDSIKTTNIVATSAVTSVDKNLVNPMVHQWNVNIERELPSNFKLTLAYVGTRGEKLFVNDQYNPYSGWDAGDPSYGYVGRVNVSRGAIAARTNHGDSIYHGFSTTVEHRFSNSFLLRSAWTWGHSIDTGSEVFTSTGGSSYMQNMLNMDAGRREERADSAFDIRHRWTTSYSWDLPTFKTGTALRKFAGAFANGWQLSGTLVLQTGAANNIYTGGFDENGDSNGSNDRPYLGNASAGLKTVAIDGSMLNYYFGESTTKGTLYDWGSYVDSGALVQTTASSVHWVIKPGDGSGTIGRNTWRDPGYITSDLAVARTFKIPRFQGHSLKFRVDMFNWLNHKNMNGGYDTSLYDLGSGFLDADQSYVNNGYRAIRIYAVYNF